MSPFVDKGSTAVRPNDIVNQELDSLESTYNQNMLRDLLYHHRRHRRHRELHRLHHLLRCLRLRLGHPRAEPLRRPSWNHRKSTDMAKKLQLKTVHPATVKFGNLGRRRRRGSQPRRRSRITTPCTSPTGLGALSAFVRPGITIPGAPMQGRMQWKAQLHWDTAL